MRKIGFVLLIAVSGFLGGAVCSLVLHGTPAAAQAGDAVPDVVRAKGFEVVDDTGKRRASLSVEDGGPVLRLYDAAGDIGASLAVLADGTPGLVLCDAAGEIRGILGLLADGIVLRDTTGKPRAQLSLLADGTPGLTLFDAAGKTRAILRVLPDGRPGLTLWDDAGKMRAVFGCTTTVNKRTGAEIKHPEATVTLLNADGDVLWQAP